MRRKSVDFPAPLAPTRQVTPAEMVRFSGPRQKPLRYVLVRLSQMRRVAVIGALLTEVVPAAGGPAAGTRCLVGLTFGEGGAAARVATQRDVETHLLLGPCVAAVRVHRRAEVQPLSSG